MPLLFPDNGFILLNLFCNINIATPISWLIYTILLFSIIRWHNDLGMSYILKIYSDNLCLYSWVPSIPTHWLLIYLHMFLSSYFVVSVYPSFPMLFPPFLHFFGGEISWIFLYSIFFLFHTFFYRFRIYTFYFCCLVSKFEIFILHA